MLAHGQRYCLECGARAGARDPLLRDLLEQVGASAPAEPSVPARALSAPPRHPGRRALAIWGPLAAAFLGFGVLLGAAASSNQQGALAASRQPLKLVVPSSPSEGASSGAGGSAASSSESARSSGEASASEGEAASSTPAAAPAPSKKTAASGSSSQQGASPESSESATAPSSATAPASKLPAIKHVFVITLSDEPYASVFGPASGAAYLAHTLEHRGELLVRYYAVAHEQLANEIALVSGQGPTPETEANCSTYTDVPGASGSQASSGCVYPRSTPTLMAQLAARHLSWRAYVQGLGVAAHPACAHPALGEADPSAAQPGGYATFRDPFVYFHSVTDVKACQSEVVGLDKLTGDLKGPARTPSFSYIVPDRCHDGNPTPCAPGAAAGLATADTFLRQVVPGILASKAYKQAGLLVITVDEAPSSGELADSSSCCAQPRFPLPGSSGTGAAGGGQVGALLLSPFVKSGATNQEPYNHFSLLRTFEDLFGLAHLGYAGAAHVSALEPSLFTAKGG
jgi:hypothetical protein